MFIQIFKIGVFTYNSEQRNVDITVYNTQSIMKYLKIFICVIYFIVYAYSCNMTKIESESNIWGYICTAIFAMAAFWAVGAYTEHERKKSENNQ